MKKRKIGQYDSYTLEADDMVVVMGEVARHADLLRSLGLEEHPETKEYVGTGAHLYEMVPETFYDLFSGRQGDPDLIAQATDGETFYQIDALPVVDENDDGTRITELTALDFETRASIEEGVSNFRVG